MAQKYFKNRFGNVFGVMTATPIGRATFVHLVKPNEKYKPAKYGVTILFPKDDAQIKKGLNQMIAVCKDIAKEAFGEKVPAFSAPPIMDGDEKKYQGFAGNYYIQARSTKPIEIVDTQRKGLDPNLIAPGVLVKAVVTPILYDQGFTWQLNVVQFIKDDGTRYYGGPDPKSLLEAIDEAPADTTMEEAADAALGSKAPTKKNGKEAALDML